MAEAETKLQPHGEPVGWLETVTLPGSDQAVRVVFDGREGHRVFLRQADPGDGDPPRIPIYEGDEPVVMLALSHLGNHLTEEVGRIDDLLTSLRIVPVRREASRVYARTLRQVEADTGDRVHVRPGDQVSFEEGAIVLELDAIDAAEAKEHRDAGYVPITPVLWTWLRTSHDLVKVRYLLAAARRLDATNLLLNEVERMRGSWRRKVSPGRRSDVHSSASSVPWRLPSLRSAGSPTWSTRPPGQSARLFRCRQRWQRSGRR